MQPVRIKYWGLVWMTRRGFLTATAVGIFLVVLTFVILGFRGELPPLRSLWEQISPQRPGRRPGFWESWTFSNLYRLLLLLLVAYAFETYLVLRRFSKLEADQARQRGQTHVEAINERHSES